MTKFLGPSNTKNPASLLFVAAEHCSSFDLLARLQLLSDQGKLARIVVDEVHFAITWSDFCSSMYDVHRLHIQKNSLVPLVLLEKQKLSVKEEQLLG
jgi:superfamily II DNA helicase RecQ